MMKSIVPSTSCVAVTDSPLPAHVGALYNEEPHEEPPTDLPSKEDIHFWTHGEDREDEE